MPSFSLRGLRAPAAAVTTLVLAACGGASSRQAAERAAGGCTIHEPGGPPSAGASAYVEHVTPTARGGFGTGSLGVTLVCAVGGAAPEQVVLILPNLVRGGGIPAGNYRVRSPYHTLTEAERGDPRLAWVRVQRGAVAPLLYTGVGGWVVITRAGGGVVEGAYQVAVVSADSGVALPGAKPEVDGPLALDSIDGVRTSRTVLGGAFVAPRREADWRGR